MTGDILLRKLGWDNASDKTEVSGTTTDLEYFSADIRDGLVRVVVNDWPYSGLYFQESLLQASVVSTSCDQCLWVSPISSYGLVYRSYMKI